MRGSWNDFDCYKAHGGVYAIDEPDFPRIPGCPSCRSPGDAVGSSGHSTMYRCPSCDCEWARNDTSGQIHSEKYKRFEDVDRLADVHPADDAPLPVVWKDNENSIDRIDERIDALEAMVKRIAAHLGIE